MEFSDEPNISEVYSAYDVLASQDPHEVSAYVRMVWSRCNAKEQIRIACALLDLRVQIIEAIGVTSAASRRLPGAAPERPRRGGARNNDPYGPQHDPHDIRVYRLLALADTVHDFGSFDPEEHDPATFPAEIPPSLLESESEFAEGLCATRTLHFADGAVPNPLFGVELAAPYQDVSDPDADVSKLFARQTESRDRLAITQVEVWTVTLSGGSPRDDQRMHYIKLVQLARLVCAVHKKTRVAHVVVDASAMKPMQLVLINVAVVRNELIKLMTFLPGEAVEDGLTKSADVQAAFNKLLQQRLGSSQQWIVTKPDAQVFDSGDAALAAGDFVQWDDRPTGAIFRPEMPYQVTLRGLDRSGAVWVRMELRDKNQTYTAQHTGKECTAALSIRSMFKKPTTGSALTLAKNIFSDEFKYALKRAGDWGQVEHCKRYDKIFATCDRMAAMYAAYRGVHFIYLRFQEKAGPPPNVSANFRSMKNVLFWRHVFTIH